MSKRANGEAAANGGTKHAEKEAERIAKMEKVKAKLDEMASEGCFAQEQSVGWSSEMVLNYKTFAKGTLYCPLKGCGRPVDSCRFGNHLLDSHSLTGEEKKEQREALRILADAIVNRQRSLSLDCRQIPRNLMATEEQLGVWKWITVKLEGQCVPVMNKDAIPKEAMENSILRRMDQKLDKLLEAEKKRAEKDGEHLNRRRDVVAEEEEIAHPVENLEVLDAVDDQREEDEEEDGATAVEEEPRPAGAFQQLKRNVEQELMDRIFDSTNDPLFPDHIHQGYNHRRTEKEQRLAEELAFWHKLVIEKQPLLLEYKAHLVDLTADRENDEDGGGMMDYVSYASRFMLCCMRYQKRLDQVATPYDFLSSYSWISNWFAILRRYEVSASVIKTFANSLTSFGCFIRKKLDAGDNTSNNKLQMIFDEIKTRRNQANRSQNFQNAFKGTVPGRRKIDVDYTALCAAFRCETIQQRFREILGRFDGSTVLDDDYRFMLEGCIYSSVVLNGSRPEAAYKLRAGGINGANHEDGARDSTTGLQRVEIGEHILWSAPYPVPKQVVTKNALCEDLRGILIFEELSKSWIMLYAKMRQLVLSPERLANPKERFFVRKNGKTVGRYAVSSFMKSFLARSENGSLSFGCNLIRHEIANQTFKAIVDRIYNELKRSGVPMLQNHKANTQLKEYTQNLYQAVALGYLELRKIEEGGTLIEVTINPDESEDTVGEECEVDEMDEEETFVDTENINFVDMFNEMHNNSVEEHLQNGETIEGNGERRMEIAQGVDQHMSNEEFKRILTKHNNRPPEVPLSSVDEDYNDFCRRSNAKEIQDWPWLHVGDAGEAGLGVFAKCDIKKHSIICDYRGAVMKRDDHQRRLDEVEGICDEEFRARNDYYLEGTVTTARGKRIPFGIEAHQPTHKGRIVLGRLINNSFKHPNVEAIPIHREKDGEIFIGVYFKAIDVIKANEEILFTYGRSFAHALTQCFCFRCKNIPLPTFLPNVPERRIAFPQPEEIVSMSQSDAAEPLQKRARGYDVRRVIDGFHVNKKLTWSEPPYSDFLTAFAVGQEAFTSPLTLSSSSDERKTIFMMIHEEAKKEEKTVLLLMNQQNVAFVLGAREGELAAILQVNSQGVRCAVAATRRTQPSIEGTLTDMEIVTEEKFNEYAQLIDSI